MIVPAEDERIVCRGAEAYGPFDAIRAASFLESSARGITDQR
jgi:hypothetical protein